MKAWRDMPSRRRRWGIMLHANGGTLRCGRRVWRWLYRSSGPTFPSITVRRGGIRFDQPGRDAL